MTEGIMKILTPGILGVAFVVYDICLISRVLRALKRKDSESHQRIKPLLPVWHNTKERLQRMTDKQVMKAGLTAVFAATFVGAALVYGTVSYIVGMMG